MILTAALHALMILPTQPQSKYFNIMIILKANTWINSKKTIFNNNYFVYKKNYNDNVIFVIYLKTYLGIMKL